ncbi:TIGR00297 family protein [Microcystis aeruginosa]|uniref:TIGR00297 family protein n=1 Tax=Microcystis aeruginosa TaxID=1126 RepID=UPI00232B0537|nr:TIGR00297 family protein [Microcystis aeruginosa]MDB9432910.1 TIGR00297 family protein [Microcystis aeruginosa CS-552/01]
MLTNPWLVAVLLNTILLGIAAIAPKKLLTRMGYLHAWVLGVIVWGSLGWRGYLIVLFYFLVGSTVTRIGLARKEAEGIAEKRAGVRGPENVWGSALAGAICAILSLFAASPWDYLLILAYVASFSTKLADTTASEVGKAYGKTTYLITNFKSVPRGTEGAVSLEGTLAGLLAATAISLLAWAIGTINLIGVLWCVIAAFIATNIESLIGATLQTRFLWLTNELVNVINTVIGAIVAILLSLLWSFR